MQNVGDGGNIGFHEDASITLNAAGSIGVAHGFDSWQGGETNHGRRQNGVTDGMHVRRLMPIECERLQGTPDDWTRFSATGEQSDSQRYRQLGNAVSTPVARWLAQRIRDFACQPAKNSV